MKILKSLLYLILLLSLLLCGIICFCALNPEAAQKIAEVLRYDDAVTFIPHAPISSLENNKDILNNDKEILETKEFVPNVDSFDDNNIDDLINIDDLSLDVESTGLEVEEDTPIEENEDIVLRIPDNVSSKNGYQEISAQTNVVGDIEAKEVEEILEPGNLGSDLAFDKVFYPYYAMMDDKGKLLYKQMYANVMDLNNRFSPVVPVGEKQLRNVFFAVYNDHPELFWLDAGYSGKIDNSGRVIEINMRFNDTISDIDNAKIRFDDNVNQYLSQIGGDLSDFDKEAQAHNLLVDSLEYNLRAPLNQSAYSAVVNKETVCAGYARAMQYLCQKMGIPCYYCTGYAGEAHAWNIIGLDDGFYNVDVTWADTDPENYDYFNKNDYDYSSSHRRRDLSLYLPPCDGQKYSDILRTPENNVLPTLDDVGLGSDRVLNSYEHYIDSCKEAINNHGIGDYVFVAAIAGDELFDRIDALYSGNDYKKEYLEESMKKVRASQCRLGLEIMPLQNDIYYITHKVSMR